MRRRWCWLVMAAIMPAALPACGADDARAKPKAGRPVVVATFPPGFTPRGVAVDGKGTVYTSGWDGERFVTAVFPKKGKPIRHPIPCATSAGQSVGQHGSMAATPDGTLFWAMKVQHRIVRIDPNGGGDCYAGTGEAGFSGDSGRAIDAKLNRIDTLAYDPVDKALYVADAGNLRVRKIDATGVITTVVEPAGMSGGESIEPMNIAFDTRRGRLYAKELPGIAYRSRDGQVNLVPNSRGSVFPSQALAPDPTGGDLVTTRIIPTCEVVRISDGGQVRGVPGGRLTEPHCAYQSVVDALGDIWMVTDNQLVVLRPGR